MNAVFKTSSREPFMSSQLRPTVALLCLLPLALACGGSESPHEAVGETTAVETVDSAPVSSETETGGKIDFSAADLDLYERGIAKEVEIVKGAAERTGRRTPEERAVAMRMQWESESIPAAARAAGIPEDRYRLTREAVHEVFKMLDFQEKIDGPMSMDMSRATPEMRERLLKDPFDELSPEAAAALRARMERLVPLWIEYVNLTAVSG
jgi:hypothetical protein